ncbi:MAG TPA: class I SAM-dependent methyltransferase [Candidatus Binataceae bacterium]|nr:class I SAM-dependent methyltransferase [Candidatus Binataceae bacterium]
MRKIDEPPSGISAAEVAANWDRNADLWAAEVRAGRDLYREVYNNPAFLAFVGDLAGREVLDAGCGEGHNTRIFARRGARMIGADISTRMIELAREEERREPLGIRYHAASYTAMPQFAADSFDAVVSFMALMDGPDFPAAMRELFRVMRPAAALCFSIIHPCFMTRGFGWIRDESGRETGYTGGEYFNDKPWIERWNFTKAPGAADREPFSVPRFDRTLSEYINPVIGAGFKLEEIHEPRPSEAACRAHPWLVRWREHMPLFIYVRAAKPRG